MRQLILRITSVFFIFYSLQVCAASYNEPKNMADASKISIYIKEYSSQGNHVTGSTVDKNSALWLEKKLNGMGYQAKLIPFDFTRIIPIQSELKIVKKTIKGYPAFDGEHGADAKYS